VAHFFGLSGEDFYSGTSPPFFFAIYLQFFLKRGVDFYLDRFCGVPGVDLYSGMEQTRRVDLYEGGGVT